MIFLMKQQIDEFVEYLKNIKNSSDNTVLSYKRDLERMALYMEKAGVNDVTEITVDKLAAYVAGFRDEQFAVTSIVRHYTSLKAFFRYLVENGNISENPAEGLKTPKIEKLEPRILARYEVELLLEQDFSDDSKGKRDKAILELLYATGLKSTEMIELKLSEIDMSLSCVRLSDSRVIPYGQKAKKALNEYLLFARKELLAEDGPDDGTVFLNYKGQPMSRQGFWKLIKTYVKRAGIDSDITPYSLRHSFAVHLIENGADIDTLKNMLGYSDVGTLYKYVRGKDKKQDPYEWARIRN